MQRLNISSGQKWEESVGYSQAVKIGNFIEVSGTVSSDNSGEVIGLGDVYLQTKFILMKLENTLKQVNANLDHVIRTRIFTTDIKQWEKIAKAHAEVFENIKPACTLLEVKNLIDPRYLIEIEASAIVNS